MNQGATPEDFLSTHTIREPEAMKLLLENVPLDATMLFDLCFQASFASRIFTIIQREGSATQGIERMQQSLADSVQAIMKLLRQIESEYHIDLGTAKTKVPSALIEDLSMLKQWMNAHKHQ